MSASATAEPAVIPEDAFELVPDGAMVAVAMSGGVDSSVAAARCATRVRTVGITLALWPRDREITRDRGCCSIDSVEDARRVATTLGIRHYVWNLENDFSTGVIADFEDEYAAGRTPNPCVRCNAVIKFGVLLDRARAIGATHVATGHYARRGHRGAVPTLHRSRDRAKDQSFTLHRLSADQVDAAVLPLGGDEAKAGVRAEAAALGLVTAAKPESQELCFVDVSLPDELERRLAGRFSPGPIRDLTGAVIGEHRGIPFYTVGQRSRLGLIPHRPDANPLYVVDIDGEANTITVGPRTALGRDHVILDDCSWLLGSPPADGAQVTVQLRAHGRPQPAQLSSLGAGRIRVDGAEPLDQPSPGQSAVIYDGDEVLGGGIIVREA